MTLKTQLCVSTALVGMLGFGAPAMAVPEAGEPNNVFGDIEVLAPGVGSFDGILEGFNPAAGLLFDRKLFGGIFDKGGDDPEFTPGTFPTHVIPTGFGEGTPFIAVVGSPPDTVSSDGFSLGASPATEAFFPGELAIAFGAVDGAGDAVVTVSDDSDENFDGLDDDTGDPHGNDSLYFGLVQIGDHAGCGFFGGKTGGCDVDFVQFQGTPGEVFVAEITASAIFDLEPPDPLVVAGDEGLLPPVDAIIGWFADDGTLLGEDFDDDFDGGGIDIPGDGDFPFPIVNEDEPVDDGDNKVRIVGIVPDSGHVNLALFGEGGGGFDDFALFDGGEGEGYEGFHNEAGTYTLDVQTFAMGDEGLFEYVELPTNVDDLCASDPGGNFCFEFFVNLNQPVVLDPPTEGAIIGYDFEILDGPGFFDTILLPDLAGDDDEIYDVFALNPADVFALVGSFGPGAIIDFDAEGFFDVEGFRVLGIDPALGLDPSDPLAFAVAATFTEEATLFNQDSPYVIEQSALFAQTTGVPEPAGLGIFGLGLIGLAALRRRKRQG